MTDDKQEKQDPVAPAREVVHWHREHPSKACLLDPASLWSPATTLALARAVLDLAECTCGQCGDPVPRELAYITCPDCEEEIGADHAARAEVEQLKRDRDAQKIACDASQRIHRDSVLRLETQERVVERLRGALEKIRALGSGGHPIQQAVDAHNIARAALGEEG